VAVSVAGLAGALAIGVAGVVQIGPSVLAFVILGPVLVVAYNAELFGGLVHTDAGFAAAWGAFPVLTGYVAQAQAMSLAAVLGAAGAFALSLAQRSLSTPARRLRRSVRSVSGSMTMADGTQSPIGADALLAPLERALRAMSWAVVALAAGLSVARLG